MSRARRLRRRGTLGGGGGAILLAVGLIATPVLSEAAIVTAAMERASVAHDGQEANGSSSSPSISADGRVVAFTSQASNLVPGDDNGESDVFVRDRQTGAVTRVSVDSDGNQAGSFSHSAEISGDGRYVTFLSNADDLVPGDTNGHWDIFVHDRETQTTTRVSVDSAGTEASGSSNVPTINADGRFVAFQSAAVDLVADDTNTVRDVFVHDHVTGVTERVSVGTGGIQATGGDSGDPSISDDGRYVSFRSHADNLVPGDGNGHEDVFVHDRQVGETELVSVATGGAQGSDGDSDGGRLNGDGRYVLFRSGATDLVADDMNGRHDTFVHDRDAGTTTRVSVASDGTEPDESSYDASISPDGRYVSFVSYASNLVEGDMNADGDVFLHDRETAETVRVSVTSAGEEATAESYHSSVSALGRHVTFVSDASDLVSGDTMGNSDVFVWSAATVPAPPTGVSATAGAERVTVSWTAPDDDGGAPITGYTVTASPGGATAMVGGGQTSATVEGLSDGTPYTFTVVATNEVGDSDPSQPSDPVLAVAAGVSRQWGIDRIETAVSISQRSFAPGVSAVYLATALDFPDALAGGPRAAADGAPILLTWPDRLPDETADELQRLRPGEVVILGGTTAVGQDVADAVAALGSWDVDRLSGADRYATAAELAGTFGTATRVFVATGLAFPDALAGGALAAPDSPILLTAPNSLPDSTRTAIAALDPDEIVLLGGSSAVSTDVEAELAAIVGGNVDRLWGPDRFATAAAVASEFDAPVAVAYVATGLKFPDALTGVPAAARAGAPLLLATRGSLPGPTATALERLRPEGIAVLGGTSAVSEDVASALQQVLNGG